MRRIVTVVALTALWVVVTATVALACRNHKQAAATAMTYLSLNPAQLAGLIGTGVVAGLVRFVRR